MAEHASDSATTTEETKRRRGLRRPGGRKERPAAAPPAERTGPEPGLMTVLWADIRGKRIPRQPTADELAWEAEEEALENEARGGVTGLDPAIYERLRQRSGPAR